MTTIDLNKTIKVKPDKTRLINLLEEIFSGSYKIPVFQRDWAWKPYQMLELFDSISKGYPVGSLLFWKPEQSFASKEYIGPYRINNHSKNVSYVLDGFQRLSTLFGALMNPDKFNNDEKLSRKEFQIFYDLRSKEFIYLKGRSTSDFALLPLYKIIDTFEFIDFIRLIESGVESSLSGELIENAKEISKIFYDYEIPYIEIRGGDIRSAVEIFSRVNSTGSEISTDFMLSALTYNVDTNFLLSENITEFINGLRVYNFSNIKRDTVLNCISNSKGRIYFDVKIEELLKSDLESLTNKTFENITRAVKFLYDELLVVDLKLLPYPTQLIFITEFFRINHNVSHNQLRKLREWFWVTTYSNYFTIYSLSQQRAAYKVFKAFAEGAHEDGIYKLNGLEQFEAAKFPEKLNFTGVRTKALQLFLVNRSYSSKPFVKNETIRELFIFGGKDRTPGNIILRKDTETHYKDFPTFSTIASSEELLEAFITDELIQLFNLGLAEEFLTSRENLIRNAERDFVADLDINYDSLSSLNT